MFSIIIKKKVTAKARPLLGWAAYAGIGVKMGNNIKECKYLGEYSGDCWLCSGNIFQRCMYSNKEKCLLLKNEQRKNKINMLEQQLLTEQAKNKKLVEALEKIAYRDITIKSNFYSSTVANEALKECGYYAK